VQQRSNRALGNYSNGWGHLIATLAVMVFASFALWSGKLASDTVMAIMSPVVTFWFMAGSVNRFNATPGANTSNAADNNSQP
jgi:hypothetical protein